MVIILIAQQIAECLRKQEENVQLQGVWVFQSSLQWALEVECLRCLEILTPFVAELDSCILCWEATPALWNSHGSSIKCCLLQKLWIMRLAKSGYPGRGRPKHHVKQSWRLYLLGQWRYILQLQTIVFNWPIFFPSLLPSPLQLILPSS